jgi:phenylpyruvate tautomerase PptA (4-oxalocrotonate tautomerase family)
MPVIDALIVTPLGHALQPGVAQTLADNIAKVLDAQPGRVWVRVETLPDSQYAENGMVTAVHPVFVKVLHASLPPEDVLAAEARSLAAAVGRCLGRPAEYVHVEYAPAGRGRVAFGGHLLK